MVINVMGRRNALLCTRVFSLWLYGDICLAIPRLGLTSSSLHQQQTLNCHAMALFFFLKFYSVTSDRFCLIVRNRLPVVEKEVLWCAATSTQHCVPLSLKSSAHSVCSTERMDKNYVLCTLFFSNTISLLLWQLAMYSVAGLYSGRAVSSFACHDDATFSGSHIVFICLVDLAFIYGRYVVTIGPICWRHLFSTFNPSIRPSNHRHSTNVHPDVHASVPPDCTWSLGVSRKKA